MRGFINTFKFRGTRWVIRGYKKNGKQKYCYSPNRAYEPIFVERMLNDEDFVKIIDKQESKWRSYNE